MRRTSVSLPTRNHHDPHEKPARYSNRGARKSAAGTLEKIKAAWMTQSQRSRYLKTGGLLLFIVFLFYFLAPKGAGTYTTVPIGPSVKGGNDGQTPSDSSYGTTKCSKSIDSSKPIVQYALMIDAGSTGSRIHVYKFNNCGPTPELEHEGFWMTEKKTGGSGLSSYGADAEGAAKRLHPCGRKGDSWTSETWPELSQKILDAVRTRLETVYPFPVVSKEKEGVVVMEGKDEGVFAWITTNYLLGKIGGPDHSETAAVFDLGGGSTQIVFEPTFKGANGGIPEKLADTEQRYVLNFGGREFELYQHSHLGYGLMSARESIHKTLIEDVHGAHPEDSSWVSKPVVNPCIAPGMERAIDVKLGEGHALGAAITCRKLAEKILQKDAECKVAPCSFNGIHQPSLQKTFAREDVYTFSYFFDRTEPLGMPESFTLKELHHLTDQVCGGKDHWDVFQNVPGALDELEHRPEHCLDLNFMMALLHTGYEFPIDREVKIAKKIKNNELGWCLGASLPLLSQASGWTCKVTAL
ncbi:guanosine-diphosphatase-like protein [Bisporella sp. PMI_857]|nr:guanosine-diphosphatase-like protein [Bisporella sp. PMI_857]